MRNLLDRIDRKIGRYAPRNLMTVIVAGTAIVWLLDYIVGMCTGVWLSGWLYFNKELILRGEIWRVVTFIFVPESSSLFTFALSMYFYWLIGNALEGEWGALRFDLFYLCGILGAIACGFITGYATNSYLNLSLFLAFAILHPDYQVLLFFFLPIKVKWLAILDAVGFVLLFIVGTWPMRIALLFSLANIALFFWYIPIDKIRNAHRRRKWRKAAKRKDDDYPFDL